MQKDKKVDEILAGIFKDVTKKYGDGSISLASERDTNIEAWDTGSAGLNYVLGNGGIAKGRIIEVFGAFSSGKTTATLFLIAQIQKQGGRCAFIDSEFSFSVEYAKAIGVNVDKLIFAQPSSGEEAIDIVQKLVESREVALIVVDSTAALVPLHELEGEITDSNVALQARLISKGLRMMTAPCAYTKTTVIFISQTRAKIGGYQTGPMSESTGGNALRFYSSIRLEVKKLEQIKEGTEVVGNRLKITAVKNKVSNPFRSVDLDLYFASGFDLKGEMLDRSIEKGIIEKSGNTYSFAGEKIGVGKENVRKVLIENEELYQKILKSLN
jgi:recombination protein RecA